jgi:hypothetical protein
MKLAAGRQDYLFVTDTAGNKNQILMFRSGDSKGINKVAPAGKSAGDTTILG